ncbi:hypothetical protein PN462_17670 [Spirulina sp. CS-785/01]|nr:hypothetical protein [Spirulina sp. CS-785/01]
MTAEWDGITKSEALRDDEVVIRHALADAAKQYNWKKILEILSERPDLINVTRPDGRSLYTPLHQSAHGNAPGEVVQKMLDMGAWRTIRNLVELQRLSASGERDRYAASPWTGRSHKLTYGRSRCSAERLVAKSVECSTLLNKAIISSRAER